MFLFWSHSLTEIDLSDPIRNNLTQPYKGPVDTALIQLIEGADLTSCLAKEETDEEDEQERAGHSMEFLIGYVDLFEI